MPDLRLPPGSVIGILGGGQLGRMTALAAARLGYQCHIFDPEPGGPAAQVASAQTNAAYDDRDALDRFAATIDVATYEFENIPVDSIDHLLKRVPVRPGPKVLATAQDRVIEKAFLDSIDVPIAPHGEVQDVAGLARAAAKIGLPAVLKTARLGYDGKGQVRITQHSDLDGAYKKMGATRGILESWIDFELEISVIVARAMNGELASYDVAENRHGDHILAQSRVPARISADLGAAAQKIAERIAEALDLVGLVAVEMFVLRDGGLIVNEIAPRPHNSGHWTMDASTTCQFEQFVRAVCGLPLGPTARHADVIMTNLIGAEVESWPDILTEPRAHLHLYGKHTARPGRKMGHVNRLFAIGELARI